MKVFLAFTFVIFILLVTSSVYKNDALIFFSKNHTNLLKGFAILTVFWGHIGSAYSIHGIQWIAGIGVSLFLICSGYGLEASYNKNGLKKYWIKRFLAVILPYWIIYLISAAIVSNNFTLELAFQIIIFIKANWYIRYILIIYIIYWALKKVVLRLKLSQKFFYVLLFSTFILWFIIESLFFAKADAPSLLARQMFAFPLGIVIYDHFSWFKELLTNNRFSIHLTFMVTAIFSVIFLGISQMDFIVSLPYLLSNTISLLTVMPLAFLVIRISCLCYKLFNNGLFNLLGTVSYEIYLIQYFSRQIINQEAWSLYICFIVTILLAITFQVIYKKFRHSKLGKI